MKSATLRQVINALIKYDGTGDPHWVEGLITEARRFNKWKLGYLDPGQMNNDSSDAATAEEYAEMGVENAPPIVVVPSESGPLKWDILDGAHRAAAAELAEANIQAYYPVKR